MAVRLVIIGGGPAGNSAATVAASIGAEVTMIERDIVGGAAHLWDCIPSKAMVATGNELAELAHAKTMGLEASGRLGGKPQAAPPGCVFPARRLLLVFAQLRQHAVILQRGRVAGGLPAGGDVA